jgi:thiamine-phosphate pyrophosphorylase
MIDFRLYFITGQRLPGMRTLEVSVEEACRAGVRAVQLRQRELDVRSRFELALRLRAITSKHGAALLVNDRVDVALAAESDGVHCPESGFPPAMVHRLAGADFVVGASAHSLARALDAESEGADFITFGPVFDTPSKASFGPPQGLDRLRKIVAAVRIPVFAIGGISPATTKACIECGAAGVAVVSAILSSPDIAATVGEFKTVMGSL